MIFSHHASVLIHRPTWAKVPVDLPMFISVTWYPVLGTTSVGNNSGCLSYSAVKKDTTSVPSTIGHLEYSCLNLTEFRVSGTSVTLLDDDIVKECGSPV